MKKSLKDKTLIDQLLNYDMNVSKNSPFIHSKQNFKIISFIWALGKRIWEFLNRMYETTLSFFQKDYANFIMSLWIILSFCCYIIYLKIISHDGKDRVNPIIQPTYDGYSTESHNREIGELEDLANLNARYAIVQAFNSWLIILYTIFLIDFTREVSFLLDLIKDSIIELVFFMLTFSMVIHITILD